MQGWQQKCWGLIHWGFGGPLPRQESCKYVLSGSSLTRGPVQESPSSPSVTALFPQFALLAILVDRVWNYCAIMQPPPIPPHTSNSRPISPQNISISILKNWKTFCTGKFPGLKKGVRNNASLPHHRFFCSLDRFSWKHQGKTDCLWCAAATVTEEYCATSWRRAVSRQSHSIASTEVKLHEETAQNFELC